MNDNMNTAFGWILASCGIALGGAIVTDMYFQSEEPETPGYFIDAPEEDAIGEEEMSIVDAMMLTSADAGQSAYAKCSACHTIEQGGAMGIGPNLYGVMGSPIGGHSASFAYSDALSSIEGNWDIDSMDAWLANPAAFASGTKMTFAGISDPEERASVILYLISMGGDMSMAENAMAAREAELASAAAEAPAEEGGEEAAAEEGAEEESVAE